jgi:lipid-A-disaccharide synthase
MNLYLIAGEDSGDLHAANLIRALKALNPDIRVRGTGGDRMKAAGTELVVHLRDMNFMGFVEVAKNIGTIRKLFRTIKKDIVEWKPEAVILLDYPGFNLRMAKFLSKAGIRCFYYISPQVWAWKKNRVQTIRDHCERMFVILPFEQAFYANEGVEVDFVGHPLLDEIRKTDHKRTKQKDNPLVALLPGSRYQEIRRMLPVLLQVVPHFPDCRFVIAGAPSLPESVYHDLIGDATVDLRMNRTYEIMQEADFALVTSGTATLESALFGLPQIVVYKGGKLSYRIGKMLVDVKYISLVNLIMDRPAVTELIQEALTEENLVKELSSLMQDNEKLENMMAAYAELWERLGDGGASARTAELILSYMKNKDKT